MIQSRIANGVRGRILKDATRDTGCGLKVFRRAVYLRLPYFDALHRFMPALVAREGFSVVHGDVVDRPAHRALELRPVRPALGRHPRPRRGMWLIRRRRRVPQVVTGETE